VPAAGPAPGPIRIFDTFPFDGELEVLAFRLEQVHDLVDALVLVEAGETYRGDPKPFLFDLQRDRFAWAWPKLRHIKLAALGGPARAPRAQAAVQRNAVMLGLRDLEPQDVVLLLDVDEIPSRSLLRQLRAEGLAAPRRILMTRHHNHLDTLGPASPCCPDPAEPFPQGTPRHRPGPWSDPGPRWSGRSGVAAPGRCLLGDAGQRPFDLRFGQVPGPPLEDGGRHLSAVDPGARLETKLARVFHAEWAGARALRPDHLRRCREYGVHPRGWWFAERPSGPLPEDLAKLAARCPETARAAPLPAFWRRRRLRAWAWVRLWPGWPERLVAAVDARFEGLAWLLTLPLLAAEAARLAWAAWARRYGSAPVHI